VHKLHPSQTPLLFFDCDYPSPVLRKPPSQMASVVFIVMALIFGSASPTTRLIDKGSPSVTTLLAQLSTDYDQDDHTNRFADGDTQHRASHDVAPVVPRNFGNDFEDQPQSPKSDLISTFGAVMKCHGEHSLIVTPNPSYDSSPKARLTAVNLDDVDEKEMEVIDKLDKMKMKEMEGEKAIHQSDLGDEVSTFYDVLAYATGDMEFDSAMQRHDEYSPPMTSQVLPRDPAFTVKVDEDENVKPKLIAKGDVLTQGDVGDKASTFYVVESGDYDVQVFSYTKDGAFGELALMHHMPHVATIECVTASPEAENKLREITRQKFRNALTKSHRNRHPQGVDFLKTVDLFKPLLSAESLHLNDKLISLNSPTSNESPTAAMKHLAEHSPPIMLNQCITPRVLSHDPTPSMLGHSNDVPLAMMMMMWMCIKIFRRKKGEVSNAWLLLAVACVTIQFARAEGYSQKEAYEIAKRVFDTYLNKTVVANCDWSASVGKYPEAKTKKERRLYQKIDQIDHSFTKCPRQATPKCTMAQLSSGKKLNSEWDGKDRRYKYVDDEDCLGHDCHIAFYKTSRNTCKKFNMEILNDNAFGTMYGSINKHSIEMKKKQSGKLFEACTDSLKLARSMAKTTDGETWGAAKCAGFAHAGAAAIAMEMNDYFEKWKGTQIRIMGQPKAKKVYADSDEKTSRGSSGSGHHYIIITDPKGNAPVLVDYWARAKNDTSDYWIVKMRNATSFCENGDRDPKCKEGDENIVTPKLAFKKFHLEDSHKKKKERETGKRYTRYNYGAAIYSTLTLDKNVREQIKQFKEKEKEKKSTLARAEYDDVYGGYDGREYQNEYGEYDAFEEAYEEKYENLVKAEEQFEFAKAFLRRMKNRRMRPN